MLVYRLLRLLLAVTQNIIPLCNNNNVSVSVSKEAAELTALQ